MMRFCPNCETERGLHELFCEGEVAQGVCNWELGSVPIRPSGWRPTPAPAAPPTSAGPPVCPNGHPAGAGDLLCGVCGADVGEQPAASPPARPAPEGVTVVEGWQLGERLPANSRVCERFRVAHETSGEQGVLTLYNSGSEPDSAVYEVLRSLPREHVPAVMATGRWQERAFEVSEEIAGGTLGELGLLPDDPQTWSRVVEEVGRVLQSFSECGLRHRDLTPEAILVRSKEPLDLVVTNFGSARLSDFDLDIVSPLETNRYTAPEAVAGGVSAASDWWSLGMILLEQVTRGACFEGVNEQAFLIHVLTDGAPIPPGIEPRLELLLRGLLARDRRQRWSWAQVRRWLDGEELAAPASSSAETPAAAHGPVIKLAGRDYASPRAFALGAADAAAWGEARDKLLRGAVVLWAEEARLDAKIPAGLRQVMLLDNLSDDFRLSLALKILNASMPLICRGDIVTPGWLLDHPEEGYELITGPAPDLLSRMDAELWLSRLKARAAAVRERARQLEIALDEEDLRVHLLSTSQSRLAALWDERRRVLPDTDHSTLLALLERRQTSEEDLILLLSAAVGQFRTADTIVAEAAEAAARAGLKSFDRREAAEYLLRPRREIYAALEKRVEGFARCGIARVDELVDQFRLERRMALAHALVVLAVPPDRWREPPKQAYVANLLDFFAKRVAVAVQRGPLSRMTIGKTTARVDLTEFGSERRTAAALLEHLLLRSDRMVEVDPSVFDRADALERRTRALYSHATLYRRDTGIDGLYLGFPFLLTRLGATARPRISPVLLWPVRLRPEVGARGRVSVGFDRDREEVRLNPAFDGLLGAEVAKRWQEAANDLLGRGSLTAADAMDAFGMLATAQGRTLVPLPGRDVRVPPREDLLSCAAVFFHLAYMGQAVLEDLRQLKTIPPVGTGLETVLRVADPPPRAEVEAVRENDRFLTSDSDPSQEAAVFEARRGPGLVVEGPPGTGKSQTIVNMVSDAIGRQRSLLVVCQKQAALEVVHKRLEAEGLAGRVIMITDINRDRERTVRAVREQLEDLRNTAHLRPQNWRQSRLQTAARVESLEKELDLHQAALHEADPVTGLTYRKLLGELIGLELEASPRVDAPGLRKHLSALDVTAVATLEEACGPLARYWLPARFEESPLADLLTFGAEPGRLAAFGNDFEAFAATEAERQEVSRRTPAASHVEDAEALRAWLETHAQAFRRLADEERRRLVQWLPLFQTGRGGGREQALLTELRAVGEGLEGLKAAAPEAGARAVVVALSDDELGTWLRLAEELARPASFFARLSPWRWSKSSRLKTFFRTHALGEPDAGLPSFIAAARDETTLRPWRRRLEAVAAVLEPGARDLERFTAANLLELARGLESELVQAAAMWERLRACPQSPLAVAAVCAGSPSAFEDFVVSARQGLERHEARARSLAALSQLGEWFAPSWLRARQAAIDSDGSNEANLARIVQALPTLAAYQRFRIRAAHLDPLAVAVFRVLRASESALAAFDDAQLDAAVRRTIAREARLAWKARLEEASPALLLEADELEAKAEALAAADEQMRQVNRRLLIEGIDTARLAPPRAWEDITRLRGQRARRLREFLDRGVGLGLTALRPVWLMNPDVASRVLPLKAGLFDAVIYDEASQIPVEYALPTLFRSKSVMVSGDEKQMPPTAFFSGRVENDEADTFEGDETDDGQSDETRAEVSETWNRREIKDCPDLLQLAKSVLPTTTLQIHYRSAYRELISFSNAAFYANDLSVPVRHPDDEVRRTKPVEVIRADGLYQDQTNRAEAEAVGDLLKKLWSDAAGARKSVGVVTFNRKQADLIEEVLERRAERDAVFQSALAEERERVEQGEDMGFFVKNVENVQGDERDIIVFSSTFGRNAQGTFRRSFGVLGQTGGERRLNVAVTRAREKVILVTSMPVAEISDLLTTVRPANSPRDYLQAYFEYARAVSAGELDNARMLLRRLVAGRQAGARHPGNGDEADGFQSAVRHFIESLGWRPVAVQDESPFGLDFAIEDPRTGLYGIGIDCDAPRHRLLARARAREMWRPSVLKRSIPHVHRVSSHRWYHDAEDERRRLRTAIERALPGRLG
ncbi:MAG TPA: AAA domain-containing protein [Pyrinomonadaceae bacterium]|nr:AAA domain-containing protein [Pyrinomonadaceae bacterium]